MAEQEISNNRLKFRRAKPVRLFELAAEQIRALIKRGELKPGDRLPSESELGKLLDVSRSSVREALRALESSGYIEVRSGLGAYVVEGAPFISSLNASIKRLSERKTLLIQLLQVRQTLECLTVSLAAKKITKEEIRKLEAQIDSAEKIIFKKDIKAYAKELSTIDLDFHLSISKISGNEIASELLAALVPAYDDDNVAIFHIEEGVKLIEEHREILYHLKNQDSENAKDCMNMHLDRVIDEILNIQEKSG